MTQDGKSTISHRTDAGNEIALTITWAFALDGRWMFRVSGTVDGRPCEYRGRTFDKDGRCYQLVHVPGVADYAVPVEKWIVPACPMSDPWRAFVDFIQKPWHDHAFAGADDAAKLEEYYRVKDKLARAVMESDTVEGRAAAKCVKNIKKGAWGGNSQPVSQAAMEFSLGMGGSPMKGLVNWMIGADISRVRVASPKESPRRREVVI